MLLKSKNFPQFVKNIEKLKLSLSKQHNKMLKIRSEMLKTRKKGKTVKLEKFSLKNFPRISQIPGIPRIFKTPGISREVENPRKRETLVGQNDLTIYSSGILHLAQASGCSKPLLPFKVTKDLLFIFQRKNLWYSQLVAYLFSYHEKAINALYELA